jgi:hypothetical protein
MKPARSWILALVLGGLPGAALAQLQALPDQPTPCWFGGQAHSLAVRWHNAGSQPIAPELRWRLYQTSSSLAVPLMEKSWRKLDVLPGQTVLEFVPMDFPAVNTETTFLIQWLAESNRVAGKTEVRIYPTNVLAELKLMVGDDDFGVLDPGGLLKPALQRGGVRFLDLGELALEDFSGKLVVIGPFSSAAQMREGRPQTIQQIARKGVAVVWIQPPAQLWDELTPSFYVVPEGKAAVLVVHPELVADFADSPKSQLNLIHCCKLALNPAPPLLPYLSPQP